MFDLDTKTGTLTEATGQVSPDYYFTRHGSREDRRRHLPVDDGIFTSCSQEVPDWSFRLGEARVEVDGYAHVRYASMRAKKLPVFYTPYILWPVKSDRTSGFLIPNIGYSDRRGASLGLAYFQTLGRSYDTTFHVDTYSEGYPGPRQRVPLPADRGDQGRPASATTIRDPEPRPRVALEGRVEPRHRTTCRWACAASCNYQDFSDFNFFRDFERDFDRNTLRFIDSRAFVTGNWGPHLLNVLAQRPGDVHRPSTGRSSSGKLPEIEYRLRSTRLGRTPLYLQCSGLGDLPRPRPAAEPTAGPTAASTCSRSSRCRSAPSPGCRCRSPAASG